MYDLIRKNNNDKLWNWTESIWSDLFGDPDLVAGSTPGFDTKGFPPYNIIAKSDNEIDMEFAVAGVAEKDLSLEVVNGVLHIEGKAQTEKNDTKYLKRGIAKRAFKMQFTLNDLEVKGAKLEGGLLTVNLIRFVPDEKKPKQIPITTR